MQGSKGLKHVNEQNISLEDLQVRDCKGLVNSAMKQRYQLPLSHTKQKVFALILILWLLLKLSLLLC